MWDKMIYKGERVERVLDQGLRNGNGNEEGVEVKEGRVVGCVL